MTSNMADTQLPHYGVHTDPRTHIKYLFQDTCPYGWEFIGVNKRSSLSVKHLKNQCSHHVNVHLAKEPSRVHWNLLKSVLHDPLVQAMLPTPKPRGETVYYFDQDSIDNATYWFSTLERLASPLNSWVKPLWTEGLNVISRNLRLSNIHPMVLTDIQHSDQESLMSLNAAAKRCPRTLIFSGPADLVIPKEIIRLETKLPSLISLETLMGLPLEAMGTYILAKHCRDELLFPVDETA